MTKVNNKINDPDVYILRTFGWDGKKFWWMFSRHHSMKGDPRWSREKTVQTWIDTRGPIKQLTRYQGVCRMSEAAAAIAEIRSPIERPNKPVQELK